MEMLVSSLSAVREDLRQCRTVTSVSDGEATHATANDNAQQIAPLLGLLDLDIQTERADRGLSILLPVPDLVHDALHVVPKLRELATLHLSTP